MKLSLNRSIVDHKKQNMNSILTQSKDDINIAFVINADKRAISKKIVRNSQKQSNN